MFFLLKKINIPKYLRFKFYPSLNRALFRSQGVKFGENLRVFNKVYLNNKGSIFVGDNFMLTSDESINPISSNLRGSIYVEKGGEITIGNNVGMSSTRMWIANSLTIGNNVKIGACCLIIDTDTHQLDYQQRRAVPQNAEEAKQLKASIKSAPIVIEDDVWVGAHCIILKGVTIGAHSVIGAGSVVTKSIPADCIAAGNPAKIIRFFDN